MSEPPPSDPARIPRVPSSVWPQLWPQVRAAFVLAHIGAVIVLAIPDARGVAASRASWKSPTVQAELEAWAERLTAMGLPTDPSTLEDDVFEASQQWTDLVGRLRAPVTFYSDDVGVYQTWRMFVAPHRYPAKLQIELEEDGHWRTIYLARSGDHDWRGAQLDHVRTRAVLFRYGWPRYKRDYAALARWIAARAAEDFPTATRVRVQMLGYRTPTPEEARQGELPESKLRQTIVHVLEGLR